MSISEKISCTGWMMGVRGKINSHVLLLGMLLIITACAVDGPVERDYYNDLSRIKGGEKPTPPAIQSVVLLPDRELQITFSSDGSDGPTGPDGAYDPDAGTNDDLIYFLYYTAGDSFPSFPDESDYYREEYYLGYVREADFSADPKDITGIYVNPAFTGRLYFWMSSWDGGRESDHSNIEALDIP